MIRTKETQPWTVNMRNSMAMGICAALMTAHLAHAATRTPELQTAVRAATFEVVLRKVDSDPLTYEKPLPLDLIPYSIRSDHYWSVGTPFAVGPETYVAAGHVFRGAVGSQFGSPALRDSAGHVYAVNQVLKFSAHEDFVVRKGRRKAVRQEESRTLD